MSTPFWIVMVVINRWDLTQAAIADCLAQRVLPEPPQVLVVDGGLPRDERDQLERWSEKEPRLHAWFHTPALPSLSASWNLALRFVWSLGGEVTLVINNDVRVHPSTYSTLFDYLVCHESLFVSAVGRREDDLPWETYFAQPLDEALGSFLTNRGGPDYSCFLITREGHLAYPFDEGFIPAYGEDCDHHRRLMLAGDGHRIFSINLPYLHYGSATVNADPTQAQRWAKQLAQSRAYYARKWGGPVNHEQWRVPFDPESVGIGITNPELQAALREAAPAVLGSPAEEAPHAPTADTL